MERGTSRGAVPARGTLGPMEEAEAGAGASRVLQSLGVEAGCSGGTSRTVFLL